MHLLYNLVMLAISGRALRVRPRRDTALIHAAGWNLFIAMAAGLFGALFLRWGVFGMMQSVSWFLFVHLPAIFLAEAMFQKSALPALPGLLLIGVGVDAFLIEPYWLEVSEETLEIPHLSSPLTIALVADLQTVRIGDFEREVFDAVRAANPDVILFAGDYLQLPPGPRFRAAAIRLRAQLDTLSAPLGGYAVLGDVDPRSVWTTPFDGSPVTALRGSQHLSLREDVVLTALSVNDSRSERPPIVTHPGRAHVVLGHGPDFMLTDPPAELMLAGHTHGGQVQLPWFGPLLTFSAVPKSWASGGIYPHPHRGIVVVSRGIGMERGQAPWLRFLCRPQLVVLHLRPKEEGLNQPQERDQRGELP